ncbi:MAG: hypothetical protein QF793_02175 [Candidatus Peribacteraceae bacterium]|nr:hypothetical protein [Candidatus Peribacteraceae bacterium]
MIKKFTFTALLTLLVTPTTALAYLNPEEVLLSRELFLPPTAREAQARTAIQSGESAARREREQDRAFELQHPIVEEPVFASAPEPTGQFGFPQGGYYVVPAGAQGGLPQGIFGSVPQAGLDDPANLELLRTMRLLSRVNQNQATSQLQQVLHSSAGDLAPTGAGSILAAMVMLGSIFYVLRRAKKSETQVRTF